MSYKARIWYPAVKYGNTVVLKEIVDTLPNWTMFRGAFRCIWFIAGIAKNARCQAGVRQSNCGILSCRIHPPDHGTATQVLRSFVVVLHLRDVDFRNPAVSINSERVFEGVLMTFSQWQTLATSWRDRLVIALLTWPSPCFC